MIGHSPCLIDWVRDVGREISGSVTRLLPGAERSASCYTGIFLGLQGADAMNRPELTASRLSVRGISGLIYSASDVVGG